MSQPSPMRARQDSRPVFPACLLLEGKPCLVVGGGKIALRKTRLLLEAAAQVRVVASDACAELRELAAQGQITQEARPFADADVEGAAVVFAATNDRAVNARVLELCERRGVLSCAVDKGWVNGNFLTPATYRKDELTIAISSGGQSCRRSRLIKDSLARHVAVLESAELLVLGTSHDYLSIQERSAYHLTERRLEEAGAMIMQVWGVHEFMLLNTCNRVELIAVVSSQPGVEPLLRRILKFDQLPEEGYYLKRGFDAFSHSAFAIAGLLSQTPGENHITAQFKEAASLAAARGWAGSLIEEWLAAALHISKHIRTQVAPLLQVEEIEELCIQYLRAQRGELRNLRAVVIGSGVIGAACVRLLVEQEGCE